MRHLATAGETRLQFNYDEGEYISTVRAYFVRTVRVRVDLLLAVVALAYGGLAWLFYGFATAWVLAIGAGLMLLAYVVYMTIVIPQTAFQRLPKLRDTFVMRFSEDGLRLKTERLDQEMPWNRYKRVLVSKTSYLLIYGPDQFTVIPKRAFRSPEQDTAFQDLLDRKVSRYRRWKTV
ncbi:MAG: YcxB family protein [Chloroflexota bacterium]